MRRLFKSIFLLGLLSAIGFTAYAYWTMAYRPLTGALPVKITVSPGDDIQKIADQIEKAGVRLPSHLFILWGRATGDAKRLKVGSYGIDESMTSLNLLENLVSGKTEMSRLVVVEGWTFRQMRQAMDKHPDLVSRTKDWSEAQILEAIGATEKQAEGLFFPDTYLFAAGTTDLEIFKLSYGTMKQKIEAAWQARDPAVPYRTPYEAIVLASIVEKETGHSEDRPKIASVFVNRLRKGMRLESDPTVIYGMGDRYTGTLLRVDLKKDTPYNTYTRFGLPPTPIALPGFAAIEATLRPLSSDKIFFVARGDGTGLSEFNREYSDHQSASRDYWQRIRGNGR